MVLSNAQWILELVLIVLLGITLFHALRLERALGVLRRDRSALEALVTGFNESTRQAEGGIDRLRVVADGAGRQIARHVDQAKSLKNDLAFLTERGEKLADQLDGLVRLARPIVQAGSSGQPDGEWLAQPAQSAPQAIPAGAGGRVRSEAEQELLRALRSSR